MSKLSRETEVLLERGRGGTPLTPAHRERLRGAILAKASGVAVVASAGSASAWTSIGAKIVGAALLVATVGGAGAAIEDGVFLEVVPSGPNRALEPCGTSYSDLDRRADVDPERGFDHHPGFDCGPVLVPA
jgi:hypothetical protein